MLCPPWLHAIRTIVAKPSSPADQQRGTDGTTTGTLGGGIGTVGRVILADLKRFVEPPILSILHLAGGIKTVRLRTIRARCNRTV